MNRFLGLLFGVAIIVAEMSDPCYAGKLTFWDNFSDGKLDGWIFASRDGRVDYDPALNWSVADKRLLEDSGWDTQFALVDNISFSSQSIAVKVEILYWAGIALWYRDINNFVIITKYPSGAGSAIYVGEVVDGIASTSTYTYSGTQSISFNFRVDANSSTGQLDFYVGGEHVFTHTVQTTVRTGLSGLVSGNGGGYFDNFRVTSLDAETIILDPLDYGHYESTGLHQPRVMGYVAGHNGSGIIDYRDFFVFDLTSVTMPVLAAELQLRNGQNGYDSINPTETYVLHGVSTPIATLISGGSGLTDIYDDLGSGTLYGSVVMSQENNGQIVSIQLNRDFLKDIRKMEGLVALGGSLTDITGAYGFNEAVFWGSGTGFDEVRLVLTTPPHPHR